MRCCVFGMASFPMNWANPRRSDQNFAKEKGRHANGNMAISSPNAPHHALGDPGSSSAGMTAAASTRAVTGSVAVRNNPNRLISDNNPNRRISDNNPNKVSPNKVCKPAFRLGFSCLRGLQSPTRAFTSGRCFPLLIAPSKQHRLRRTRR